MQDKRIDKAAKLFNSAGALHRRFDVLSIDITKTRPHRQRPTCRLRR